MFLLIYDKSQKKHVKFDKTLFEMYMSGSKKTLSRNFFDELTYVCDYSPN